MDVGHTLTHTSLFFWWKIPNLVTEMTTLKRCLFGKLNEKNSRVSSVFRIDRSFFLLSNHVYHIWVPMSTLKASKMFKTFPPTVIFSVYLESWSLGYQQGGPLLTFSSFNPNVSCFRSISSKVGGTIFPCTDFFKKLLRPVVSAFALNLSWAIAIGTIFYNDILNTHRPINICCMFVTYTKWWLLLNVAIWLQTEECWMIKLCMQINSPNLTACVWIVRK